MAVPLFLNCGLIGTTGIVNIFAIDSNLSERHSTLGLLLNKLTPHSSRNFVCVLQI